MEMLHPTPAILHEYARGVFPDRDALHTIEQHLSDCASCRRILEEAPDDPFIQTLKAGVRNSSHEKRRDRQILGGYELKEELGRGGMGVVYRATQLNLGRDVALKRIAQEALSSDKMRLRFRREAELMASVKHRALVQVLDYGEFERTPFLVLELLSNRTLASVIRCGPLKPRLAAQLIATICRGLAAVHAVGIVHRDIKPGNILLGDPDSLLSANTGNGSNLADDAQDRQTTIGDPRLADFGLAFSDEHQLTLARTGLQIGTPCYMAPEQIRAELGPADSRADLYSIGATLYECLTGRAPFRGSTALETMEQACRDQPIPPRRIQPEIPVDLQTICLTCLAKLPADRYRSASELADDLERFLLGQPILARPISPIRRLVHWSQQNPWRAALLVLAAFALTGGFAGVAWHNRELRKSLSQLEIEQGETQAAREQADTNYEEARRTIRQMLNHLQARSMDDTPRVHELIEQQTASAFEFLSDLQRIQSPIAADVYIDLIDAYIMHGNSCYLLGKSQPAEQSFERAIDLARQLIEQYPEPENQLRLSEALIKCSLAKREPPDVDLGVAEAQLQEAEKILEQLDELPLQQAAIQNEKGWLQHHLGTLRLQQQRFEEAAQSFAKAVEIRMMLARETEDELYRIAAAESMTNLALCYSSIGNPTAALDWHQKTDQLFQELIQQGFGSMAIRLSIGANKVNWCGTLLSVGDLETCVQIASDGLDEIRPIAEQEPDHVNARDRMYGLLGNRALARLQLSQFDLSYQDWRELLDYCPDENARVGNSIIAALTAAYSGRTEEALTLISSLPESPIPKLDDRYNIACVFAICAKHLAEDNSSISASDQEPAAGVRDKAIEILLDLESTGYFQEATTQQLQQDADLDALRDELEFQSLVTRLEAKLKGQNR